MNPVTPCEIPAGSLILTALPKRSFADAYRAPLAKPAASPADIFLAAARSSPRWIARLMALRNRLVRLVGLKDVGQFNAPAAAPAPRSFAIGDRLGIFTIVAQTAEELLLGIDDRHLDVRVCVTRQPQAQPPAYVVSTIVDVHNALGHTYMLPVSRIHPFVVRAMMRNAQL